jgi:hypothetical protein
MTKSNRHLLLFAFAALALACSASAQDYTLFVASLDGTQEVPPNKSEASGYAYFLLSADQTQFITLAFHNVENANASHIHRGEAGVSGPIIHGFRSFVSPIIDVWNLTKDDVNDLMNGNLYINVHSRMYGGGEVRGQIFPYSAE